MKNVTVHKVWDPMWQKTTIAMKTVSGQYGTSYRIWGQDNNWHWWDVSLCDFHAALLKARGIRI